MRLRNTSRDPGEETHDAHFMGAAIEKFAEAPGYLVEGRRRADRARGVDRPPRTQGPSADAPASWVTCGRSRLSTAQASSTSHALMGAAADGAAPA